MSPCALVFILLGGVRRWLSRPVAPLEVRPRRGARVDALPAHDGGDAPGLDDDALEVLDPDEPLDIELRIYTTRLYWLLVRAAQHARDLDDDEDVARAVMAEIELNAAKVAAR